MRWQCGQVVNMHMSRTLDVMPVADENDGVALLRVAQRLEMDLGHQRAGGVEAPEPAGLGLAAHRRRDAVSREDHDRPGGHVPEVVGEHRALALQVVDHVPVVHDLVPHVDRRAVDLERQIDDIDGAVHAGAEAAGGREVERVRARSHGRSGHGAEEACARVERDSTRRLEVQQTLAGLARSVAGGERQGTEPFDVGPQALEVAGREVLPIRRHPEHGPVQEEAR